MANLSTIKEEKKKNRSGQGGKKRKKHLTGNKKSTPKKDMKIAQLEEVFPGIAGKKGKGGTLDTLKRLGIKPQDLVDGNYSWLKKKL